MQTHPFTRRLGIGVVAFLLTAPQLVMPIVATAQNASAASFELRPYCIQLEESRESPPSPDGGSFAGDIPDIPGIINPGEETDTGRQDDCNAFQVHSPSMMRTEKLRQGDTLDLHLVLNNPQRLTTSRIRSWLVYDPSILRGDVLALGDAFPVPTPGEAEFSAADGYAKIGASAAQGHEPKEDPLMVAHVTFTVLSTPYTSTVISFYDAQGSAEGHTYAMTNAGGERDILAPALPSLLVLLEQGVLQPAASASRASNLVATSSVAALSASSSPASSSTSSVEPLSSPASSTTMTSTSSQSPTPVVPSLTFSLLQPQNLRVTSDGDEAYLAWDPLPSSELVGYNIYYGTVSGNYMQRRSVDRSATSLKLGGLPSGTTYYFALRGANAQALETQFGQEVAVTIGNPATSTAPLNTSVFTTPGPRGRPPATGGHIGGETGLPSLLALFLIGSAVVGTLLAFRRQWTARACA